MTLSLSEEAWIQEVRFGDGFAGGTGDGNDRKPRLRGYDNIKLAAILTLQVVRIFLSPITLVCADTCLNRVAVAEGRATVNGGLRRVERGTSTNSGFDHTGGTSNLSSRGWRICSSRWGSGSTLRRRMT